MFTSEQIADKIKFVAKRKKINLKDMFNDIGLNKNVIYNMKRGRIPNIESIIKIADYLDCSLDELCGRTKLEKMTINGKSFTENEIKEMFNELNRLNDKISEFFVDNLKEGDKE